MPGRTVPYTNYNRFGLRQMQYSPHSIQSCTYIIPQFKNKVKRATVERMDPMACIGRCLRAPPRKRNNTGKLLHYEYFTNEPLHIFSPAVNVCLFQIKNLDITQCTLPFVFIQHGNECASQPCRHGGKCVRHSLLFLLSIIIKQLGLALLGSFVQSMAFTNYQ